MTELTNLYLTTKLVRNILIRKLSINFEILVDYDGYVRHITFLFIFLKLVLGPLWIMLRAYFWLLALCLCSLLEGLGEPYEMS